MTRYDESGININTYKLLYGASQTEIDKSDKSVKMLMTIDTFTKILHKKLLKRIIELNKVKNIGIELDNIKYNKETNMYEYVEDDIKVPFKVFSDQIIEASRGD